MAKILSTIMAVIMLVISSIVPGFVAPGTDTVSTSDWLYELDVEFGFAKNDDFDEVKVASEWGVLVDYDTDKLDLEEPVTADFVATTLVNAANLTATPEELASVKIKNADKLATYDKVAVAVAKGVIATSTFNTVSVGAMDADDCWDALDCALELANNKTFKESAFDVQYVDGVKVVDADFEADGDVITFSEDAGIDAGDIFVAGNEAYRAESVDGNVVTTAAVEAEDVIDNVDYEGTFAPNLAAAVITDGTGAVVSEGVSDFNSDSIFTDLKDKALDALYNADLLQKINISFSVKGFKVKAKVTDTGLKFGISKTLGNGNVNVSKEYDLQNLKLNAKFDASIKNLKFNEVYLTSKYTLVDTTTISGGYVCSLAEKELGEGADAVTFLDRVKQGLFTVKSGESKIDIARFDIPIGNTSLTISIDFSVVIGVDGSMQVVVTSNNYSGYEIINNKGRFIHDEEKLDKQINAAGDFSVCLGVGLGLGILGYDVVDVNVTGGIGASVYATLKFLDGEGNVITESTVNVAVDAVSAAIAGSDLDVDADLHGTVEVYGILKVSVGQNSLIKKIGLNKTWTIFDKSNGTFFTYTFDA
ncbi:MAG: hypothetical protein MJ147_10680 [Clostridia bacterium]|nr:hypothetical protein [Clostridia bacterium]